MAPSWESLVRGGLGTLLELGGGPSTQEPTQWKAQGCGTQMDRRKEPPPRASHLLPHEASSVLDTAAMLTSSLLLSSHLL